jgi:hypothetical protein
MNNLVMKSFVQHTTNSLNSLFHRQIHTQEDEERSYHARKYIKTKQIISTTLNGLEK